MIGAGFGGLAVALLVRAAGLEVHVSALPQKAGSCITAKEYGTQSNMR